MDLQMLMEHTTREQVEAFIDTPRQEGDLPAANKSDAKQASVVQAKASKAVVPNVSSNSQKAVKTTVPTSLSGSGEKQNTIPNRSVNAPMTTTTGAQSPNSTAPTSTSLPTHEYPADFEGMRDHTAIWVSTTSVRPDVNQTRSDENNMGVYDSATNVLHRVEERFWPDPATLWPGSQLTTLPFTDSDNAQTTRSAPRDSESTTTSLPPPPGHRPKATVTTRDAAKTAATAASSAPGTDGHPWAGDNTELHTGLFADYLAWTEEEFDVFGVRRRWHHAVEPAEVDSYSETTSLAPSSSLSGYRSSIISAALTESDTEGASLGTSQLSHLSLPSALESTHAVFADVSARAGTEASIYDDFLTMTPSDLSMRSSVASWLQQTSCGSQTALQSREESQEDTSSSDGEFDHGTGADASPWIGSSSTHCTSEVVNVRQAMTMAQNQKQAQCAMTSASSRQQSSPLLLPRRRLSISSSASSVSTVHDLGAEEEAEAEEAHRQGSTANFKPQQQPLTSVHHGPAQQWSPTEKQMVC